MKMLLLYIMFATTGLTLKETAGKDESIDFIKGTFDDALAIAKKQDKPVFVYVHATWCGQCRKLKKSFKDDAAAAYYNKNFVCVAIDGETPEGERLRSKYGVKVYPTLMIVNSSGQLQTKTTGYHTPYILMNFGKRIVAK